MARKNETMTYYVYKAVGKRRNVNWELSSTHEDLAEAEKAARDLCPKGEEIETEPGRNVDKGFFGSRHRDEWSAMLTSVPEREE